MEVKEIMMRDVEVISPDYTIQEAAQKMKQRDIGVLPVCEDERLVGMLTDRDIVVRSTAEGNSPDNMKVRHVMTPNIEWCFEDQEIEDVCNQMQKKKIRRLPVMNRDKKLVGIVSLGDLAVQGDKKFVADVFEKIAQAPPD